MTLYDAISTKNSINTLVDFFNGKHPDTASFKSIPANRVLSQAFVKIYDRQRYLLLSAVESKSNGAVYASQQG